MPVVAEDLGVITPPVERLRRELGFPGMVVLQFTRGRVPASAEEQSVVYTGTHDNDTTRGWWEKLPADERAAIGGDPSWTLIERAWESQLALAIAPLQDVLGLGGEARMNFPGTEGGNWSWRFRARDLTAELAARLRTLTARTRRTA